MPDGSPVKDRPAYPEIGKTLPGSNKVLESIGAARARGFQIPAILDKAVSLLSEPRPGLDRGRLLGMAGGGHDAHDNHGSRGGDHHKGHEEDDVPDLEDPKPYTPIEQALVTRFIERLGNPTEEIKDPGLVVDRLRGLIKTDAVAGKTDEDLVAEKVASFMSSPESNFPLSPEILYFVGPEFRDKVISALPKKYQERARHLTEEYAKARSLNPEANEPAFTEAAVQSGSVSASGTVDTPRVALENNTDPANSNPSVETAQPKPKEPVHLTILDVSNREREIRDAAEEIQNKIREFGLNGVDIQIAATKSSFLQLGALLDSGLIDPESFIAREADNGQLVYTGEPKLLPIDLKANPKADIVEEFRKRAEAAGGKGEIVIKGLPNNETENDAYDLAIEPLASAISGIVGVDFDYVVLTDPEGKSEARFLIGKKEYANPDTAVATSSPLPSGAGVSDTDPSGAVPAEGTPATYGYPDSGLNFSDLFPEERDRIENRRRRVEDGIKMVPTEEFNKRRAKFILEEAVNLVCSPGFTDADINSDTARFSEKMRQALDIATDSSPRMMLSTVLFDSIQEAYQYALDHSAEPSGVYVYISAAKILGLDKNIMGISETLTEIEESIKEKGSL